MKLILGFLPILLVITACSKPPDYSDVIKSQADFIAAINVMEKELPSVNSAEGTARLLDEWTQANNNFVLAGAECLKKHPQLATTSKIPPELTGSSKTFSRIKIDHARFLAGVTMLTKRFYLNPDVMEAQKRFGASLDRIDQLKLSH